MTIEDYELDDETIIEFMNDCLVYLDDNTKSMNDKSIVLKKLLTFIYDIENERFIDVYTDIKDILEYVFSNTGSQMVEEMKSYLEDKLDEKIDELWDMSRSILDDRDTDSLREMMDAIDEQNKWRDDVDRYLQEICSQVF